MTKDEIVERARYALTHSRARYRLGAGGYDPGDRLPDRRTGSLDCSGFVAWCLGLSRKSYDPFLESVNGGWIETTGIVKDALDPGGIFTVLETASPGDLYVWGDRQGRQGHVGVVSEVEDGKPTKVIHASLGNDRAFGRAIAETGPEIFVRNNAILAEYDPSRPVPVVEPEPEPEPEPKPEPPPKKPITRPRPAQPEPEPEPKPKRKTPLKTAAKAATVVAKTAKKVVLKAAKASGKHK